VSSGAAPAPAGVTGLLTGWHRLECWIAVAGFGFIAVVLIGDVLGRELIGPLFRAFGVQKQAGVYAAQKMSVYALVVGSFAGIGIATATASHLLPRVGFGWAPSAWGPALDRLADVVTGVFLLAWPGTAGLRQLVHGGRPARTVQHPGLADPAGHTAGLPVGRLALLHLRAVARRAARAAGVPGMTGALFAVGLVLALLFLRQPLLVILLAAAAWCTSSGARASSTTSSRTCGSRSTRS
jgi:hypothetical protein